MSEPPGSVGDVGKKRIAFACSECRAPAGRWSGRCPSCGAWGTVEEARSVAAGVVYSDLGLSAPEARLSTGFDGVDRVLGAGLVRGSVVLLAGEPGIGKSTLLLQLLDRLSRAGHTCLLASGEESAAQVADRARRLGLADGPAFVPGRELPTVLQAAAVMGPAVLALDSVQAARDPELDSAPGGPAQVRLCVDRLVGLAKERGISVILTGQVTKDGDVAGPRTMEHAVDVVCTLDGDPRTGLRILAGGKNRFGPEGELAWFEMRPDGLAEADPASLLTVGGPEPGSAVGVLAAGRRAFAVEVQALAVPTEGPSRRHASGLDPRRFSLVAAVVDRVVGLRLSRCELYGAAAGGVRVEDPASDLAVAAALASAATGVPPPAATAFVGEVSLTGAVRTVPNLSLRLAAASAAGIRAVLCASMAT